MRVRLPRSRWAALVVVLAVMLTGGGASLAATVFDADYARNADKVDGRHAVGANATLSERAGRLVAANTAGRLPNDIIRKAPDANLLDGLNSTAFQRRVTGTCAAGSMVTAVNVDGTVACATDAIDGGNAATLDGQDSTLFQTRVTGACPAGQSIRTVNADGTVLCATDTVDGGNAATLDGLDSLAFQLRGARTILVRSGGTPTENGTALRSSLFSSSIPFSGDTAPTATNPWVVRLEPGVYDLGTATLNMRDHVHIVGAGTSSWITCKCDNFQPTVKAAGATHLRSVTVETTGDTTGVAMAIHVPSGENGAVIADVHAVASGGTTATRSIQNDASGVVLDNVNVTATGVAPQVEGIGFGSGSTDVRGGTISVAGPTALALYTFSSSGVHDVRDVEASATGADAASGIAISAYTSSGQLNVTDSILTASGAAANHAVYVSGNLNVDRSTLTAVGTGSAVHLTGGNIRIGGSRLDGATTTGGTGTIVCGLTYRTPGYTETNAACG